MDQLAARDVRFLLDALHDDDGAVATAALRALVRLPLTADAWRALESSLQPAMADLLAGAEPALRIPARELVDGAARVPVRGLRELLREAPFSAPEGLRGHAAEVLAEAGDPAALRTLPEPGSDREASWPWALLPRIDVSEASADLIAHFAGSSHPEARWWIAVALAAQGDEAALREVMAQLRDRPDDFPFLLIAPPDLVARKIAPVWPLPESAMAILHEMLESTGVLEELATRAHPPGTGSRRSSPDQPRSVVEREAALEEAERLRGAGWPDLVRVPEDRRVLAGLDEGSASELLVDLLGQVAAAAGDNPMTAISGCNHIAGLADDLGWHVRTDAPDLLPVYATVREVSVDAARHVGWLVAGMGLAEAVAGLEPALSTGEPDTRVAAARLIEETASTAGLPGPPYAGAGGGGGDDLPPRAAELLESAGTGEGAAPPADVAAPPEPDAPSPGRGRGIPPEAGPGEGTGVFPVSPPSGGTRGGLRPDHPRSPQPDMPAAQPGSGGSRGIPRNGGGESGGSRGIPRNGGEGAGGEEAGAEPQPVLLGASSPAAARPGDEFTARFVAHTKERQVEVREMLERLSPDAVHHLGLKEARWKPGTRVTVSLDAKHLGVDEPEQHFEWSGDFDMLEWDVEVPEDAPRRKVVLKYDVYVEGLRVAKLRTDLKITDDPEVQEQQAVAEGEPASSAFVSYSSKDELRVEDRVAAVRISTGMDLFFSRDSMHAGRWEPQLEKEINDRDLFLLFWSDNARKSKWVEWEWQKALTEKGIDAFQLHPLEPKEVAPPPPELSDLQFEDPLMIIRRYDEQKADG